MQNGRKRYSYKLGNTVAAAKNIDVFKAVNDKHTENRCRKRLTEIAYVFRQRLFGGKNQKRQKSCEHGGGGAEPDGDNPLQKCHFLPTDLSTGFLNRVIKQRIHTIVGIINDSEPKIKRHAAEDSTPTSAV